MNPSRYALCIIVILVIIYIVYSCIHSYAKVDYTTEPYDIYLINMDKHSDRLQSFQTHFNASDLYESSFTRFPGILGDKLDIKSLVTTKAYGEITTSEKNKYRTKHYQLTRGGVGCYLSHIEVMKMIWNSDKNMGLIFEDDAVMDKTIKASLSEQLTKIPSDWDILLLGYFCNKCTYGTSYNKVNKFFGLHGYLVSRSGIRKILKYCTPPIDRQIDSSLSDMAEKGMLNIYTTKQKYVRQDNSFKTSIQIPIQKQAGVDVWATE